MTIERSPLLGKATLQATMKWQQLVILLLLVGLAWGFGTACTAPSTSDSSPTTSPDAGQIEPSSPGSSPDQTKTDPQPIPAPTTDSTRDVDSSELSDEEKARILDAIATDMGNSDLSLTLHTIKPVTWPDGCLGLPESGEFCTMALVDGWTVEVSDGQHTITYRTNLEGTLVRREQ